MSLSCFHTGSLTSRQAHIWRAFNARAKNARPEQDPSWADIHIGLADGRERHTSFFWCEQGGEVCLTALGVRYQLPIPGRAAWLFDNGPTVEDPVVLDEWLRQLRGILGSEVAKVTLQPAMALDAVGDAMETALDEQGFVRRRSAGLWATLEIDLTRTTEELLASFRHDTRRRIRQSLRMGIEVSPEDGPAGWSALAELDAEMAKTMRMNPAAVPFLRRVSEFWLQGGSGGTVLVARYQNTPLAAALLIVYRSRAHLRFMPTSRRHRSIPVSHLLEWEAILWSKRMGCATFDLGGWSAAATPDHRSWGVNNFKRGFAPNEPLRSFVAVHEWLSPSAIVQAAMHARNE